MRAVAVLLLALLLPGCVLPPLRDAGPIDAGVAPLAFDREPSRWVAALSSGCGMCGPTEGGFAAEPEAFALFVFESGRLLLVEWNGRPPVGETVLHEGISYDRAQVAALLRVVAPQAEGAWVVRVRTAVTDEPRLAERLAARWAQDDRSGVCTDHGERHVLAPREGETLRQDTTCVGEASPFHAYAATMWGLARGARERGAVQGRAP